jgi:hypothetical protein
MNSYYYYYYYYYYYWHTVAVMTINLRAVQSVIEEA